MCIDLIQGPLGAAIRVCPKLIVGTSIGRRTPANGARLIPRIAGHGFFLEQPLKKSAQVVGGCG